MEILELLHAKLNIARRVLAGLVANYESLDDNERLDQSNTVMDQVNSYIQIQQNLIFPVIRRTGEHDDIITRTKQVHDRIETLTEHAIMMHVDEPGYEYYDDLARLMGVLDLAEKTDHEVLFPWANAYLTDEDQYQMVGRVKEQTRHESLPEPEYQIISKK
jgi:hypothetical protein